MTAPGPLAGLRVIDMATVLAGPHAARYLADFGADVIKVEPPGGDSTRGMGWRDPTDGATYWWKLLNRGKRTITLDLKDDDDLALLRDLVGDADVLIENLRPGKLEALGLHPDVLIDANPRLVICRISGFGQTGPYRDRPGFATLAEALSGFAAINGEPDGGPILPPIALTDEVAGLVGALAIMVALHSGTGQIIDVSLLDSMSQLMGPLCAAWIDLGFLQQRAGSSLPYSVPRGAYQCADGRWLALSASSVSVGQRVMELLGLADGPAAGAFENRVAKRDQIEAALTAWVGERSLEVALAEFDAHHIAAAPILDMKGLVEDPHAEARELFVEVDGTPMQNVVARLSATPGSIRWAGRPLDADGEVIRKEGWG